MVKWSERYAGKWLPPPRLTSEPNRPLTRADCYEALQSTINKARSIEEEIAKSKLSLFTRIWHSPRGGSSEFDVLLSSTHNQIPPVLEIEVPKLGDERPEHLLSELLDVDKDFLDSSGTYPVISKVTKTLMYHSKTKRVNSSCREELRPECSRAPQESFDQQEHTGLPNPHGTHDRLPAGDYDIA